MKALAYILALVVATNARADSPDDLQLEAETMEATGLNDDAPDARVVAEGRVRAESSHWKLRAPRIEYDRRQRTAIADGGIVAQDGVMILTGRRLVLDLGDQEASIEEGLVRIKRGVSAAQLTEKLDADPPDPATELGTDATTMKLSTIQRIGEQRYAARDVWITTCDCRDRTPFLALNARRVEIVPDDEAVLHDWRARLFDVPILPFDIPVPLTISLASRRTGFLFPGFSLNGPGGMTLELPLFVTLGESADVTFTGRWSFGTVAATSLNPKQAGIRGLNGGIELRWRPAETAEGSLRITLLDDLTLTPTGEQRGLRGGLSLVHTQTLAGGRLAAKGDWLADNALLFDTQVAIDRAQQPYLRSALLYSRPLGPSGSLAFESLGIQNISTPAGATPGTFVRFPTSKAGGTIAPVARVVASHLTQLGPVAADLTGTLSYESALPGLALQDGHARRLAAELFTAQQWPLFASSAGYIALDAGERLQQLHAPELSAPDTTRLAAYTGTSARLRFGRTFASGWRHDVVPSMRVRALWGRGDFAADPATVMSETGLRPQSELDVVTPGGFFAQGLGRIETTLASPSDARTTLYAEQHLHLSSRTDGQRILGASWTKLRWALFADAFWTGSQRTLDGGGARITAPVGAGTIATGARYLTGAGSDQIARPVDALFAPVPVPSATSSLAQADLQVGWPVTPTLLIQSGAVWTRSLTQNGPLMQQYALSLAWQAAGCARLTLQTRWNPVPGAPLPLPTAIFSFDLGDPARLNP